jgi:hypothetical protein
MPLVENGASGGGGSVPSGTGAPLGSVTPSGVGALYVDDQDGGLYIAVGATSADWVQVGGGSIIAVPGVDVRGPAGSVAVEAPEGFNVSLRDLGAHAGTGNGLYWNYSGGMDGAQDAAVQVGSTGQHRVTLGDAAGTTTLAGGGLIFPSADPHIVGAWWDNGVTLMRSAG